MRAAWRGLIATVATLGCVLGESEPAALDGSVVSPGDGSALLPDGAMAAVCASELDAFRTDLWVPLMSLSCVGCHNTAGTARASRFVLRSETEAGWIEHNYRASRAMAMTELGGVPMLLLRPTGRHPMGHTGGTVSPPGSTGYAALERFVASARSPECEGAGTVSVPGEDGGTSVAPAPRCTEVAPGPRLLRRLTIEEYDRTVRDLLGTSLHPAERFAPDPVVDGFHNDANSLQVSPLLGEQLRVAAETLAEEAARNLTRVSPCAPTSPTDAVCARRFIEAFGLRAFRRPPTAEEVNRYAMLHATISAGEGFNEGVEAVLSAMLQSPNFLYRSELGVRAGDTYQLTPWEVATELSYLLTGTMPDGPLFEAARTGALATGAGIEAQTRRLLATPGARESMRSFVRQWLDVGQLSTVPKDAATFMSFTPEVRSSMAGEFDRFVDAVLSDPAARLPDLLTSSFTFVDARLATFYGLTGAGTPDSLGFRRVAMPEAQRMGVLSLGAVMSTHARPNSSSPVHRGRMVRERLLCQILPPPPPGVSAQPPVPDTRRSLREQYAMHSSVRPCVDCHRLIDPIGFTFESFDGVGRFRTTENGMPIDTRGEILGSVRSNGPMADVRGLVERLAASPEVHDCFAKQMFRYAYAIGSGERTSCALAELQRRFRDNNLSVGELMVALTRSVHFSRREGDGAAPPVTPGADAGTTPDAAVDVTRAPDARVADASMTPDVPGTPTPMGSAGVTTTPMRDSTWETGFCERVRVTNTTRASVAWEVVYNVAGTVTTNWNSERTGDSGAVVFRGVMWNRTLAAGESTELGFCARR